LQVDRSEFAERLAFTAQRADSFSDGKCIPIVPDRLVIPSDLAVCVAKPVKRRTLPTGISDAAADAENLGVDPDGLGWSSRPHVDGGKVVQAGSFGIGVTDCASQSQRVPEVLGSRRVLAQREVCSADVDETTEFAKPMAITPRRCQGESIE